MAGDFEDRLASLLMIAASGNDAEALAALRTAGSLLNEHGIDWSEVARRIAQYGVSPSEGSRDGDCEQKNWLRRGILTRANEMLRGQQANELQRAYLERVLDRIEHRSLRDLNADYRRILSLEKKLRMKPALRPKQTGRR